MLNENVVCRVCGYLLGFEPWGDGNTPSWEICPCCGIGFGYEDVTVVGIKNAREAWIKSGLKWFDPNKKPKKWNPLEQLSMISKNLKND